MTDATGHLDLDELADVLAGAEPDDGSSTASTAAATDGHLRSCRRCADRLAELAAADASVTAALRALPAPPLPPDLPGRLTRALQEERRREVALLAPRRRRAPTWLPSAAAAVALVLAGATGWSLLDPSGTSSDDAASTAAGGEAAQDSAATPQPEAASGPAAPRAASGTDWAEQAARPAAVARLLTGTATAATSSAADALTGPLDRLDDPAALAACLSGLPSGDGDLLALDHVRWDGTPALAVLQAQGSGLVRVTVVGSGCSAADPQVLGTDVLPRP